MQQLQGGSTSEDYIYTSSDYAVTWVQRTSAGQRKRQCIACSANGQKLIAGVYEGYIYVSTDGGETWSEYATDNKRYWQSIASSSDGTRLAALASDHSGIFVSP